MPNEWLFKGLQLRFSNDTGVWVNGKNEIVVLDNYMYSSGHSALFVRKDFLLEYLKTNGKTMFWPILTERMIRYPKDIGANHAQNGGYAYMDNKGFIHQKIRNYEPSDFVRRYSSIKKLFSKKISAMLLWLHQHHLVWLPKNKKIKLYYGMDDIHTINFGSGILSKNESVNISEWLKELGEDSEITKKE